MTVQPFVVDVDLAQLDDLRRRSEYTDLLGVDHQAVAPSP
jgi:hypothetical protein